MLGLAFLSTEEYMLLRKTGSVSSNVSTELFAFKPIWFVPVESDVKRMLFKLLTLPTNATNYIVAFDTECYLAVSSEQYQYALSGSKHLTTAEDYYSIFTKSCTRRIRLSDMRISEIVSLSTDTGNDFLSFCMSDNILHFLKRIIEVPDMHIVHVNESNVTDAVYQRIAELTDLNSRCQNTKNIQSCFDAFCEACIVQKTKGDL